MLDELEKRFGIDTSEAALRKAVEEFNELCDTITEIGNYRKLENPPITGYEFHVIQLVSQVCPHELILPYIKETLEEIKTREPEPKFPFRARIVMVGSEIDDPDFTKLVEMLRRHGRGGPLLLRQLPEPRAHRHRPRRERATTPSAATTSTGTSARASCPATR